MLRKSIIEMFLMCAEVIIVSFIFNPFHRNLCGQAVDLGLLVAAILGNS